VTDTGKTQNRMFEYDSRVGEGRGHIDCVLRSKELTRFFIKYLLVISLMSIEYMEVLSVKGFRLTLSWFRRCFLF